MQVGFWFVLAVLTGCAGCDKQLRMLVWVVSVFLSVALTDYPPPLSVKALIRVAFRSQVLKRVYHAV